MICMGLELGANDVELRKDTAVVMATPTMGQEDSLSRIKLTNLITHLLNYQKSMHPHAS